MKKLILIYIANILSSSSHIMENKIMITTKTDVELKKKMKSKIHIEETFEQILYYVVYVDCTLSSF